MHLIGVIYAHKWESENKILQEEFSMKFKTNLIITTFFYILYDRLLKPLAPKRYMIYVAQAPKDSFMLYFYIDKIRGSRATKSHKVESRREYPLLDLLESWS